MKHLLIVISAAVLLAVVVIVATSRGVSDGVANRFVSPNVETLARCQQIKVWHAEVDSGTPRGTNRDVGVPLRRAWRELGCPGEIYT
jgi:hypothetical protein